MSEFIKWVLYSDVGSPFNSLALLLFRVLLGWELFRVHGLRKFKLVGGQKEHVPNPLGLPDRLNGLIATCSDTVVPFLLMLGVGTRLVILPALGVTAIGYFVVHRKSTPEIRDVPYMYTLAFLLILCLGAGKYSIDALLLSLI